MTATFHAAAGAAVAATAVVDHPDESRCRRSCGCASVLSACGASPVPPAGATSGSLIHRVVPRPGAESSRKRPPRRRVTILKTMCRPSPVPPWLRRVVKNGSKARRWTSSLMPTPSSAELDLDVIGAGPADREPHGAGLPVRERVHQRVQDQVGQHLAVGAWVAVHRDFLADIDARTRSPTASGRAAGWRRSARSPRPVRTPGARRGCGRPRPA